MKIEYLEFCSGNLDRPMPMSVYGHAGRPVLFVPCQDGHHYDFANFHMDDTFRWWIESGKCTVFAIDTIDAETWSYKEGNPYDRIRLHERWIDYITREAVPFIREVTNRNNGWDGYPGIMTFGCSMGATHALNLYLRFPDLFLQDFPEFRVFFRFEKFTVVPKRFFGLLVRPVQFGQRFQFSLFL